MKGGWRQKVCSGRIASLILALLLAAPGLAARDEPSQFKPGLNLFSVQQDVQLGKESADAVDQAYPLVTDPPLVTFILAR